VYIYDKRGLEVHCLREHLEVHAMAFLPHHFLLATIGKPGVLIYTVRTHVVPERPVQALRSLFSRGYSRGIG
jgi:U3 small nucleolar RNA-associated protein 7